MREPLAETLAYGLIAEFDRPERLVEAVKQARKAGLRSIDAYSPFPIEELTELLDCRDWRIPLLTLLGGIVGAGIGYGMQVYTNLAYAIDIGNRPLVAPPAFMLITFELAVLGAVLLTIGGMLVLNHLPRLHHPVFDVAGFHLASTDKFFLIIFGNDPRFDPDRSREFLQSLKPVRIDRVAGTGA
jgi:hypothetical protein